MRVLVVDDCSDLREVLSELLRMEGFDVVEAATADAALALARAMPLTAALLDHNLPDLRGDVLAARLRELQPLVHLVGMTGESALQPTPIFDGMLRKPFGPDDAALLLRSLGAQAA